MLVLERVGELVGQRDPEPRRELGAAHADPLVLGVVERQRARVGHLVHRVVEVDLPLGQPDGAVRADELVEHAPVLGGDVLARGRGRRAVLRRGEEVDVHRVREGEVALVLDPVGDGRDPGIPAVGVVRPGVAAEEHEGSTGDQRDRADHRDDPHDQGVARTVASGAGREAAGTRTGAPTGEAGGWTGATGGGGAAGGGTGAGAAGTAAGSGPGVGSGGAWAGDAQYGSPGSHQGRSGSVSPADWSGGADGGGGACHEPHVSQRSLVGGTAVPQWAHSWSLIDAFSANGSATVQSARLADT